VEVQQVARDDLGTGRGQRRGQVVLPAHERAHPVAALQQQAHAGGPGFPVAPVIRSSRSSFPAIGQAPSPQAQADSGPAA
jgi:hypothetical protein